MLCNIPEVQKALKLLVNASVDIHFSTKDQLEDVVNENRVSFSEDELEEYLELFDE